MSSIMGGKAISIVVAGGVRELHGSALPGRHFEVTSSSSSVYRVRVCGDDSSCDCKAGGFGSKCSHLLAARLWVQRANDAKR